MLNVSRVASYNFNVEVVESSWNVMAHGDAQEGKSRENWRMEWLASTLHTTSEHGVSIITTADAYNSAASSRLTWRPRHLNWLVRFAERRNLVSAYVSSHFKCSLKEFYLGKIRSTAADRRSEGAACYNLSKTSLPSKRSRNDFEKNVTCMTGEETWVYGYDFETKSQSSQRISKTSRDPHPPKKKSPQILSNFKVVLIIFFGYKEVELVFFDRWSVGFFGSLKTFARIGKAEKLRIMEGNAIDAVLWQFHQRTHRL